MGWFTRELIRVDDSTFGGYARAVAVGVAQTTLDHGFAFANVKCFRADGTVVFWMRFPFDADGTARIGPLGPTLEWKGGAASGSAILEIWDVRRQRWRYPANTTFSVVP